jgi:hypothetical protein
MRKGLLGVIVGVGLMIAQSAGAAEMVRYDKSANNNVKPEQTVAQIQMDPSCKGPRCRPCARPCHTPCATQCPPRHHHHKHHYKKQCGTSHNHKHHKHSVKHQSNQSGHNDSIEEKKMSSDRNFPAARKTSYQGGNNDNSYVEEYIDDVGREHR